MIHLDHAATALPRQPAAIAGAQAVFDWPTPGRGLHSGQQRSLEVVDKARAQVATMLGLPIVCFLSGATHALNQAIVGLRPRPRAIACDPMSHNAVRRPIASLGVACWTMPADARGRVDVKRADATWPESIDLVVITHGSNVNGVLQPVAELAELAHRRGALVVVDAAQTVGVLTTLDLGSVDAIAFSGHKGLGALPGTGVLALHDGVRLEPLLVGGTGFDAVSAEMPAEMPGRVEAGTPNLPGIAALAGAVESFEEWGFGAMATALHDALVAASAQVHMAGELPVASFTLPGLEPSHLEDVLERAYGIRVRAGLHCAPAAHEHLGTHAHGSVRVSCGRTTSFDHLDRLTTALREISDFASRGAKAWT